MKRLVCFFDGTWNVADGRAEVTNVVKLARAMVGTAPGGIAQMSRYVEGIASESGNGEYTAFVAGAVGVGLERRILEGYRFLVEHYRPGDEIHLFGFSRGGFEARSLAGFITAVGLLQPDAAGQVEAAWEVYRGHKSSPDPAAAARLASHMHASVRIRCLGCWDTIGNLGIPFVGSVGVNIGFHDIELTPLVDVGLHALAIDEPRSPFSPSLWTRRPGEASPPGQIIEQVWFPGSHANVGGGFADAGLSDIALLWMAERAAETTGLGFDFERLRATARPNPLAEAVSPTANGIYRVSHTFPFIRLIGQDEDGIPPVRRGIVGALRTSRLAAGLETINESLHPATIERYGKRAPLRRGDRVRHRIWRPRPVAAALRDR